MNLALLIDRLLICTLYPALYPLWWGVVHLEGYNALGRAPTIHETTWVLHQSMVCLWRGEE